MKQFTKALLKQLKSEGFKYVQVKSCSRDGQIDYIQPVFILLDPIKILTVDSLPVEVYEPIDSTMLLDWADNDAGVKVVVNYNG